MDTQELVTTVIQLSVMRGCALPDRATAAAAAYSGGKPLSDEDVRALEIALDQLLPQVSFRFLAKPTENRIVRVYVDTRSDSQGSYVTKGHFDMDSREFAAFQQLLEQAGLYRSPDAKYNIELKLPPKS